MCGVIGWLDFTRDMCRERDVVDAMVDTMRDRGPDGTGTWFGPHVAIGQRRLAVIDIEGGGQPMVAAVGPHELPVALVHTGEVYNFRELRRELVGRGHRFDTACDTEVVLRAYLEWGVGCVERLDGMFAFAVWDGVREELVLARDRFGVKPLYYHPLPAGVLFASEPKGLLANPLFRPEVSEHALPILFNARLALPGETPLRDLYEVKPGHVVRVDRAGRHEYPYWRLVSWEHTDDLARTVGTVRRLLTEAVDRQLVADVPLGTMLSGGLDSTVLTALAVRSGRRGGDGPMRSFTVGFAGDERDFRPTALRPDRDGPYALLAAKHLGTAHRDVTLDPRDVPSGVGPVLRARDLPTLGQFDGSNYLLAKAMREDVTVVLSGQAADEVFGGYPWFHREETVWGDTFPWLGNAPRLTDCLAPDVRRRIRPDETERDRYQTLRARVPRLPGETGLDARMREVLYFSLTGPLAYLLDAVDRIGMSVGLEMRVPFCDHRLVEYLWNVPWSMKVADGREKSLLRMAAEDLVPPEIRWRAKSGYPAMHDPAHDAEVRRAARAVADDDTSPLAGLLDADRVRAVAEGTDHTMTHVSGAHLLVPLVEVDRWLRAYGLGVRS
ncbi:asparagine synthase (glutamine-hydrolyzing) [Streptomyces asiaticus]|uniref:asparagine synthase (glutamine-hydrolyzing) n=1 Tax=Streptomyces asiaticus TaxID=114695 RepID=UPI003D75F319